MMAGTFLNLSDDDQEEALEPKIGAGLRAGGRPPTRPRLGKRQNCDTPLIGQIECRRSGCVTCE